MCEPHVICKPLDLENMCTGATATGNDPTDQAKLIDGKVDGTIT